MCTGTLDQRVVYEVARRGILERQLPLLRTHYREKRDVMVAALRSELGDALRWDYPRGGFFLWAGLPETSMPIACSNQPSPTASSMSRVRPSSSNGRWYLTSRPIGGRHMIRLAFSAASHVRIREGVARLAAAIDEELEEVSRSGPVAQQAR